MNCHSPPGTHEPKTYIALSVRDIHASVKYFSIHKQDEHLLMVMSNLSYVMSEVTPRLFDCFVTHGYPECPEVEDVSLYSEREDWKLLPAPFPTRRHAVSCCISLP